MQHIMIFSRNYVVGSLVLVATELGFRRKRVEGASPKNSE